MTILAIAIAIAVVAMLYTFEAYYRLQGNDNYSDPTEVGSWAEVLDELEPKLITIEKISPVRGKRCYSVVYTLNGKRRCRFFGGNMFKVIKTLSSMGVIINYTQLTNQLESVWWHHAIGLIAELGELEHPLLVLDNILPDVAICDREAPTFAA